MMISVRSLLLTATALLSFQLVAAEPVVVVQIKAGTELWHAYAEPPRLSQLLAKVPQPEQQYWPAAALYRHSEQLQQQKQELLTRLQRLEQYWQLRNHTQNVLVVQSLRQQLSRWQLAERQAVRIDYDLARISQAANPRLDAGHYILRVAPRSDEVLFVGAIAEERTLPHQSAASVHTYLTALPALQRADPSWLYVVQANGQIEQVGRGYWNRQHQELQPGSQVFLPLHPRILPKEFRSLNQELVQLVAHRILP
ncbi:capsule biosynthesis GfcC family protein [Alkalimonas sp. MEB108]|uniref:Capsule biosynthesis GfcC family protein n=1 Tax=Alkalimonas cellulosilytica TaxID=3058395 RepID=A0ABU7J4P5_9GAMM|nr:capsule biosynthesis GfcC family protein [Alkalimonas sp. MEB108]MEE2001478.1 capsule biosynthesis GfcC family protein [Alkalimonas sp. MEB108]